jgi:hypothetical protein
MEKATNNSIKIKAMDLMLYIYSKVQDTSVAYTILFFWVIETVNLKE